MKKNLRKHNKRWTLYLANQCCLQYDSCALFSATKHYVAVTDNEQLYAIVLDVKDGYGSVYEKFRGFEKIYDEESEDYEEHEIEAMDFTPDESMLVFTNMFTSEVVFVDPKTGERKRSIAGKYLSVPESSCI